MIDALNATTVSMVNDMARLNAISHNLANSSTAGFKKETLVNRQFVDFLDMSHAVGPAQFLSVGVPRTQSVIDHQPGTLKYSGNPLDLAIEGDGFFEVMTDRGPAYTRQGSFRLDARGRLMTEAGMPVMGLSGELMLTTSEPMIDAGGRIFEGEQEVGRIKLVQFAQPSHLEHIGNGLYLESAAGLSRTEAIDRLRQGYTEASNVNGMSEMVKMIETMRHFESGQRVIQGYGDMLDKTIRTLGEF